MTMQEIYTTLLNKNIPLRFPEDEIRSLESSWRYKIIDVYSCALVSYSWLKPLADFIGSGKCLEIMAGRGVLAKGLKDLGIDIIATDNYDWLDKKDTWIDVEDMDCVKAVRKYIKDMDYMLCSWPYVYSPMGECMNLMRELNPLCKLIYIGEGETGCCADAEFFEFLVDVSTPEFDIAAKNFQTWAMYRDELRLYK
jgi:hypothetical protein